MTACAIVLMIMLTGQKGGSATQPTLQDALDRVAETWRSLVTPQGRPSAGPVATGDRAGSPNAAVPTTQPVGPESRSFSPAQYSAILLPLLPMALAMLSSYVRIATVLALLRSGFGATGVPPASVQAGLALLLTTAVMTPTLQRVWHDAIGPWQAGTMHWADAAQRARGPVREFMTRQIDATGGHDAVRVFMRHHQLAEPTAWSDVPDHCLVPGFVLSELRRAFEIGIRILVPMLLVDLLVAAVLLSLGLFLVPPTLISLPLKLAVFLAADGWVLIAGGLLEGFA